MIEKISKEQLAIENKRAKCESICEGIKALSKTGSGTTAEENELYDMLMKELKAWKTT